LHISDTSLYKTIYNQTSPYLKHAEFYGAFGTPHTLFVEDNPTSHKARRRMLNPFFSRAGILRVETSMVAKVKGLLERIERLRKTQSINIYNAFRCVTVDIISEYAFARSMELTEKSDKNFHGGFLVAFDAVADVIWDMAYNTTFRKISMAVPKSIGRMMSPKLAAIHNLADESERSLLAYRSGLKSKNERNPVVFDGLNALEDSLIVAEAVDILAAGSDTTAYSLSVGIWHILQNPTISEKLVGELLEAIPDIQDFPSLNKLEGIPYLMACVRESIRVANAVAGRLPRIVPDNASLVVDGKRVPPGTIVGMSAYTMHTSEELWGNDARTFNPDRWLGEESKLLDQYMVSFSKGSRSCIGQNLAYAEATLVLAYLLRTYDVKLRDESGRIGTADNFTSQIQEPGILVDLVPREKFISEAVVKE
jgi:cytochrome P450